MTLGDLQTTSENFINFFIKYEVEGQLLNAIRSIYKHRNKAWVIDSVCFFGDVEAWRLFYAVDALLLTENLNDFQQMVEKLDDATNND